MDYLPMAAGGIAGLLFGWFAVCWQHLLYRQPEHRAAPVAGRKLLALRLFAAGAAAATGAAALRPDHWDAGPALMALAFSWVLVVASSTDFERRVIPNRLSYPAIAAALMVCWAWPEITVAESLLGGSFAAGAGGLLFILGGVLFGGTPFGLGDVKLMVLAGLVVGWPAVMTALLLGILAAGVPSLFLLVRGRGRQVFSYGPFLALGTAVALLFPGRFE